MDAVNIVDHLNGFHGCIEALGDSLFKFHGRVAEFAGEVAQEGAEQKHFDIEVALYGLKQSATYTTLPSLKAPPCCYGRLTNTQD